MTAAVPQRAGKLPAYGRELLELRKRGLSPKRGFFFAHVIVVLDRWDLARGYQRLVIAPDDEPAALDFVAVAGLDVIIVWDSQRSAIDRLATTVEAVLSGQPRELCAFDIRHSHAPKVIRSPALGIERAKFP
jgi:hypothetical protein